MNGEAERKQLDKAGGEVWTKLTAAGGHMSKEETHKAAEVADRTNAKHYQVPSAKFGSTGGRVRATAGHRRVEGVAGDRGGDVQSRSSV